MEPDLPLIYAAFLPPPDGFFPSFAMESRTAEGEIRSYYSVTRNQRQMFGDC